MFWSFPYDDDHEATTLQKELKYFFEILRDIDQKAAFDTKRLFSPAFSETLAEDKKKALLAKFEFFFKEYQKISDVELRKELVQCFFDTNEIEKLLKDVSIPVIKLRLDQFPESLTKAVKDLFVYLYETTMKPSRARHYKDIYPNIQGYCPFCGLESYVDPSRFTQDYDHILNKAKYPFAAVNLKNLVPMGGICNQKYKHQTDVISAPNGQRRVYPNPYAQSFKVKITLDGSILPSASQTGTWQINLISDDPLAIPYIETWDKVFSIKDRYIQSIVKDHYNDWLRDFILIEKGNVHDVNDLKARFSAKANQFSNNIYNDKKFLRYALFSFWATCNDNRFYESVLTQMRSL